MANVILSPHETLANDSESVNTWSVHLPVRHVSDVLAGRNAGVRGRKYEPTRLKLTPAIISRFLAKVKQGSPAECWPWTANKTRTGYGQFNAGRDSDGKQDTRYAHRIAYQYATGVDPNGAVVMHSCDNPPCCNPAHLSLGTMADNVADAARKGRYKGPRARGQKVSDAQVRDMRESTETIYVLAQRHGVTPAYVSLVRNGLRRKAA